MTAKMKYCSRSSIWSMMQTSDGVQVNNNRSNDCSLSAQKQEKEKGSFCFSIPQVWVGPGFCSSSSRVTWLRGWWASDQLSEAAWVWLYFNFLLKGCVSWGKVSDKPVDSGADHVSLPLPFQFTSSGAFWMLGFGNQINQIKSDMRIWFSRPSSMNYHRFCQTATTKNDEPCVRLSFRWTVIIIMPASATE